MNRKKEEKTYLGLETRRTRLKPEVVDVGR
jgi:hypothetical protein